MHKGAKYCIEKVTFLLQVAISRYRSFKVAMGILGFVNLIKFLKLFNFLILPTFAARVTFL